MRRAAILLSQLTLLLGSLNSQILAQDFRAPAGTRTASRRPGAESVLPGGRMIDPYGRQAPTGPNPLGLAVSPRAKWVASSDGGNPYSLTIVEREGRRLRARKIVAEGGSGESGDDKGNAFTSLIFDRDENNLFASEGNSGRVLHLRLPSGRKARTYDLNQGGFKGSYTGDLAFDEQRRLLYVVDQANFRMVTIDTRRRRIVASIPAGRLPSAISLSPDGRRVYVTNAQAESDSLCIVNVESPAGPRVEGLVSTGLPSNGDRPGVVATNGRIFVADAHNDAINVIDAATLKVMGHIPIRMPGLEAYRGILPGGLALHPATGWLLVAEAGINAIGVIDTNALRTIGHIPAAWLPKRVIVQDDNIYVSSAKGFGTGPNAGMQGPFPRHLQGELRRGSISLYPVPDASDLPKLTERVMQLNGFRAAAAIPPPLPSEIRHVVVIVKQNRTYDEILGDIAVASNGKVNGAAALARFGRAGRAVVDRKSLQPRLSRRGVNVTPNQHEMAARWAFSDNFYADSGERLEAGAVWQHLERNGISFRNFDAASNTDISDQFRADRFIKEVEERYGKGREPFPHFMYIHLANDRIARPRPSEGYPFEASYVADNDYALGRIVEYLSNSPWWRNMAILVTGDDAQGGVDHVDSHRTLAFVISPYAKKNYVSHVNASFPALLKTVFRLLGIPPLDLSDATAADLSDCFGNDPDFTPYRALPPDPELFNPAEAREQQQRR